MFLLCSTLMFQSFEIIISRVSSAHETMKSVHVLCLRWQIRVIYHIKSSTCTVVHNFLPAACGMVMGWVGILFLWFFWGRLAFGPTFEFSNLGPALQSRPIKVRDLHQNESWQISAIL